MITDIIATVVVETIGVMILALFAAPFVLLLVFACADFLLDFSLSRAVERWIDMRLRS